MLLLNWFSSACIVQAGDAGYLYVNTRISMVRSSPSPILFRKKGSDLGPNFFFKVVTNRFFFAVSIFFYPASLQKLILNTSSNFCSCSPRALYRLSYLIAVSSNREVRHSAKLSGIGTINQFILGHAFNWKLNIPDNY